MPLFVYSGRYCPKEFTNVASGSIIICFIVQVPILSGIGIRLVDIIPQDVFTVSQLHAELDDIGVHTVAADSFIAVLIDIGIVGADVLAAAAGGGQNVLAIGVQGQLFTNVAGVVAGLDRDVLIVEQAAGEAVGGAVNGNLVVVAGGLDFGQLADNRLDQSDIVQHFAAQHVDSDSDDVAADQVIFKGEVGKQVLVAVAGDAVAVETGIGRKVIAVSVVAADSAVQIEGAVTKATSSTPSLVVSTRRTAAADFSARTFSVLNHILGAVC